MIYAQIDAHKILHNWHQMKYSKYEEKSSNWHKNIIRILFFCVRLMYFVTKQCLTVNDVPDLENNYDFNG